MNDDDRVNRINAAPFSPLPEDMVRMHSPVQLMVGAGPDNTITVGLLFRAGPPLGAVEFMLTGSQVTDLYDQLHDLTRLTDDEVATLRDKLHKANE